MVRRTMWARPALVAGVMLGLGAMTIVQAQTSGSGMFGSRNLGSSNSGRSSSRGSTGTAGSGLTQASNVGQITGSERFIRGSRTANQFVGADSGEGSFVGAVSSGGASNSSMSGRGLGLTGGGGLYGTSGLGLMGMSGLGGLNQRGLGQYGNQRGTNRLGNNAGFGGMGGFGAMGGMRRNVNLRTQMAVDFPHPVLEGVRVRNTIERRVNATDRIQKRGPLQIEVVDRIATLRGVVATEDDRALAVRMARLEPGISEVRDELTVGPSEPAPPTPQDR